MKKIGIVGSRRRDSNVDLELCRKVFNSIYEDGDIIVSGHCPKGADAMAEIFAKELNLTEANGKLILHRPDWDAHGKAAGFVRNTFIAEDSDVIIALLPNDGSHSYGTEDTVKKAIKLGKQILLVDQPSIEEFDPLKEV